MLLPAHITGATRKTLPAVADPSTQRLWRWTAPAVLLLAALILGGLVWGFVRSAARVTVTVDDLPVTVSSHLATVGELLDEMQIVLRSEDYLLAQRSDLLQSGMVVAIQRARPLLVDDGGRVTLHYTHAGSVAAALAELGITANEHDVLTVDEQAAQTEALLPRRLAATGRSFPGVPAVYPWRNTEQSLVAVTLRYAHQLIVQTASQTNDGAMQPIELWSTASTVGEALADGLGLVFYEGDRVTPPLATPLAVLSNGQVVQITRSKPVEIATAASALRTRTQGATVADVLAENGLLLSGFDRIEPGLDTTVSDGLAVRIVRVQQFFEIEEQITPYESVWEADPEMEIDNQRLDQEGVNGITRQRYRIVLEDGKPITRTLDDSWLAQAPVTRVNKYGSKIVLRQLETSGGVITYWRRIRMFATSYSAADAGTPVTAAWYGLTRTGMRAGYGVVAVDPRVVSLYTQLYVPGYGQAVAGDTGSGVIGKWIDLGYPDDGMIPWSRCVDVYLLGPPPPSYTIAYRLPNSPAVACLR
ncbi:MAG: ubiquitin-like domain-containing protein [Caldilineales bacterium]